MLPAGALPRDNAGVGAWRRLAVLGLLPAVLAVVAGAAGVGGAAAANGRPAILSLTASPGSVPAAGGRVAVAVRVRNAKTCTFLSGRGGSAPRTLTTVACASGRASLKVAVPANTGRAAVLLGFSVRARAGSVSVVRSVRVTQAAVPGRLSASLTISTADVPAEGGPVTLTYSSTNATSCTLGANPSLWAGANPARVDCNGAYDVTVPRTTARRQWTFTFTTADASGRRATATVTLSQNAPVQPTATMSADVAAVSSLGGTVTLTYSSTNATTCRLSVPALWSSFTTVSCSGSYDLDVPANADGRTLAVTLTALNAVGQSASANASVAQFGASTNWSGYVVLSGSTVITQVSGEWTVPALDCSATPNAGASEWVGTGGAGSGTGVLLQTGVGTDCVNGAQENYGWWELLPAYAVEFQGFTVSAGDTIRATVSQWSDGSRWQTRLDDLTTGLSGMMVTGEGWGVLTDGASTFPISGPANVSYAGGYSAEWIVEAYEANGSQVDLGAYGTVTFTNVTTSLSPWSLTADAGIELVLDGVAISTPSTPSGSGFSVSYTG